MPHQEKVPSPTPELKPFQYNKFAIFSPEGFPLLWAVCFEAYRCRNRYEEWFGEDWSVGEGKGYVIAPVIVSIIPETSKLSTDD
jgi:hypothetical protein